MILVDVELQRIRTIYRKFRSVADNAHGNTIGVSGSLTPDSLHKVLQIAKVFGSHFLDIGAGDGRPMAAAMASGASSVHGYELPQNQANAFIFNAAMRQITHSLFSIPSYDSRVRLEFEDIEQVLTCSFHKPNAI